jgi:hypothetical protein
VRDVLYNAWALGAPVIAYNAPYDVTVLDRELRRYGCRRSRSAAPIVDPLVIDKRARPLPQGQADPDRRLRALPGGARRGAHLAALTRSPRPGSRGG